MTIPLAISAEDVIFRRITIDHINLDGTVNSGAFRLRTGEQALSVDLARLTTPERTLAVSGRNDLGLVAVAVSVVLALGMSVVPDPTPDNSAHCLLVGGNSKLIRRELAAAARVVISPRVPPSGG